ncbi:GLYCOSYLTRANSFERASE [Salix koriyanagi]|uniref:GLYCOSYLTRANSFERASE n=1 Tax=Salix koriyanagi TaxID=2511006 RepID=A0A9Q0VFM0_9ROSI|nr:GLYCOSYLTRANSFERASE [Salix koriyanagi]
MANQPSHGITKQAQVVVVMVPFPAQGHLNQLLQLSRLILSYNIPVHYVGATTHNLQARKRVSGWDPDASANIHFLDMEIPPFHCPPPNPSAKIKFPSHLQPVFNASSHLAAPVSKLLRALSCKARKVIVIHDSLMGSVIQEARLLPNVESYIFRSVSAFFVSLNAWGLEGKIAEDNEFFPRDIPSLEGCYTAEFSDFVASQFNNNQKVNSGCVYNTCRLEWALGDEIVTSKIVESAVKRLMASTEGDEMRKRAAEMGESVRGSVAEGGVSRMEMESFIAHITG